MSTQKISFPVDPYHHSRLGDTRADAASLVCVKDVSGLVTAFEKVARRLQGLATDLKGHKPHRDSVVGAIHLYQATEQMEVACHSIDATLIVIEGHNVAKGDWTLEYNLFKELDRHLVAIVERLEEVRKRLRAFNDYRLTHPDELGHLLVEAGILRSEVLAHLEHVKSYHAHLQGAMNAK